MHELSVAQSIVDIIQQYIPAGNKAPVKCVRIKVGTMAGIVPDSLEFCFSAITAGTKLEGTLLAIDYIPFMLQCKTCSVVSENEFGTVVCPNCGSYETTMISGNELQVSEIELEELQEKEL
jgi:hydrogenase nickel incorporation protein HypA/HybF